MHISHWLRKQNNRKYPSEVNDPSGDGKWGKIEKGKRSQRETNENFSEVLLSKQTNKLTRN